MELLQLQYFVHVAEQGSFTSAAALLNVAQPTLSRSVRALEVELRSHLFHRNGRGAQLTETGRRFLAHAQAVLKQADTAAQSVKESGANHEGKIVVGLPPSLGENLIPTLTMRFARQFPKASLYIVEGSAHALYNQILAGRLDFAIMRSPTVSPHLSIDTIAKEDFYLVGLQPITVGTQAVALTDLVGLPLIMPNAGHKFRPILDAAMARIGASLNVVLEVEVGSIMPLVERGLGYSIRPDSVKRLMADSRKYAWQKMDVPGLSSTLSIVTPLRHLQSALQAEASLLAVEVLSDELGLGVESDG